MFLIEHTRYKLLVTRQTANSDMKNTETGTAPNVSSEKQNTEYSVSQVVSAML